MIVSVDGWWGSGKSVLRGLLDGHPKIFSCPIHDVVPMSFIHESFDSEWLTYRDTEQLRKLLASYGRYFRIERFAANQKFQVDFSAVERAYVPFQLDFYSFDRDVFQALTKLTNWTFNSICETIYGNLALHLEQTSTSDPFQIFATMGEPNNRYIELFRKQFPGGKMIYVDRPTANIIATRCGRRAIAEDYRSKFGYSNKFDSLIESGEVEKIETMRTLLNQLQKDYGSIYKVVSFEDLVLRPENTMRELATFLEIEYSEILSKFSFFGRELTCNGKKYIGEELDKVDNLLTKAEIKIIKKRQHEKGASLNSYFAKRALSVFRSAFDKST